MAETTKPEPTSPGEPAVDHTLDDGTARITVHGELTEAARRPLLRVLTDLILQVQSLHRVELDLHGVTFMNSAGLAVLVQALRMTALVLVSAPSAVVRPLQLSGLWHRFTMIDTPADDAGGH